MIYYINWPLARHPSPSKTMFADANPIDADKSIPITALTTGAVASDNFVSSAAVDFPEKYP